MRIAINLRRLYPGRIGGLEQYIRQLILNLIEVDSKIYILLLASDDNITELDYDNPNTKKVNIQESNYGYSILEHILTDRIDIYFCPLLILDPVLVHIPTAVNIPDVQHEFFPDNFTPYWLAWRRLNYKLTVQCASAIITLSKYSAEALVSVLKADSEKVFAVHLSGNVFEPVVRPDMGVSVKEKYSLPETYGYYPANTWPHKNHKTLVLAVAAYNRKFGAKLCIVLTGNNPGGCLALTNAIEEEGLSEQFIFLGYLSDHEVNEIYRFAAFLVFPSLYEGFGMPVIEAMQNRCPVLCANSTSLPEIAENAALYFDPLDPEDLADKMHLLLDDVILRAELVRKGVEQSAKYSWKRTAERTHDIFLQMLTPLGRAPDIYPRLLFSVVIVCDKLDIFAIDSILSVIGQDDKRTECIVVSSGSNLPELLSQFENRIKLVTRSFDNYYESVEAGLGVATGEVLSFLKAGDTLLPNALREASKCFYDDRSIVIVTGNVYSKNDNCMITEEYVYSTLDRANDAARVFLLHPAVFIKQSIVSGKNKNIRTDDFFIHILTAIGNTNQKVVCRVDFALATMHVSKCLT